VWLVIPSGQVLLPTLQKTLLLFRVSKVKGAKGIELQNRLVTKAHGANKMLVQCSDSVFICKLVFKLCLVTVDSDV
jgi:hypothetical protein